MNTENTFWNGRRDEEVKLLMEYIPSHGECETPSVDTWRMFQNDYYRFYNDGERPNHMRLKYFAKKSGIVGFTYVGVHFAVKHDLERIGDGLLDAAIAEINSGIAKKVR